jgi:hypothetical protein
MSNTKHTWCRAIILREAWTCLKILTSPVLPSISRSHDHPYSKSLSQTTTLGAHRGAIVKIHTLRSMTSTINTSHSESLFQPRRCKISGILTAGDDTLAASDGTLMAGDGTLTVGGITLMAGVGMLVVGDGTMTVDNSTLTVSGGTLTSNGQHWLNGTITSVTR